MNLMKNWIIRKQARTTNACKRLIKMHFQCDPNVLTILTWDRFKKNKIYIYIFKRGRESRREPIEIKVQNDIQRFNKMHIKNKNQFKMMLFYVEHLSNVNSKKKKILKKSNTFVERVLFGAELIF